ncbi:hypothetical protein HF521_012466 [Silurus meridionalis]|uniref:B1 bradykinin receptor n=1 Tax=Silurus meridionalis TaxID=175797 RepID=A0A8T0AHM0_SILME|nr:hypothetical protein HF521_012466 [Silurus meridionalis]
MKGHRGGKQLENVCYPLMLEFTFSLLLGYNSSRGDSSSQGVAWNHVEAPSVSQSHIDPADTQHLELELDFCSPLRRRTVMELNSSLMDSEFEMDNCTYKAAWDWISSLQPLWLSMISVLGLVGNSLVLLVFCLQRKPCSVADVYLGNLALANLVMVLCLPFWAVTIAQGYEWSFGQMLCKLINMSISMNYFCSIFFLVLVSIDRYLALARTMSHSRLRRSSWAKRICLGIWIFGFLVSFPSLLFRSVHYFPDLDVHACYLMYPHPGWKVQRNLSSNVLGFVIPLSIIVFCTYHIVKALKDSDLGLSLESGQKNGPLILCLWFWPCSCSAGHHTRSYVCWTHWIIISSRRKDVYLDTY